MLNFISLRLATVLDGLTRHTPEGLQFQKRCEKVGFRQTVMERDNDNIGEWDVESEHLNEKLKNAKFP